MRRALELKFKRKRPQTRRFTGRQEERKDLLGNLKEGLWEERTILCSDSCKTNASGRSYAYL
jgi:hypothetical protein